MNLNIKAFEDLFQNEFGGNYHEAERQLGIDASQLHRVLKQGKGAGLLFMTRLSNWCVKKGIDYGELIFLPKPLTNVNGTRYNISVNKNPPPD